MLFNAVIVIKKRHVYQMIFDEQAHNAILLLYSMPALQTT